MFVGAVLALDAIAMPQAVTDVVRTDVVGWICLAMGALAIVLGVVTSRQSHRQHPNRH
ncbi:hypothetical protein ENKNEFLB_04271 [Nocardioides aquaticus]|uniref:Uncharacterized protein n=2 Tax=Nocardioides aquaticus TaxID=160826 RepID=A0ABX8EMU7_9ACTN|nr:hypothetical protein ENKNEFLB_04271 [Nocardioides aquaticus]